MSEIFLLRAPFLSSSKRVKDGVFMSLVKNRLGLFFVGIILWGNSELFSFIESEILVFVGFLVSNEVDLTFFPLIGGRYFIDGAFFSRIPNRYCSLTTKFSKIYFFKFNT